ncbi:MAG: BTAD domain-containing putative transcriptional regulator [Egibacteraceae bacterium]
MIGPLEAFAGAHPLRERAWGQLVLPLHRSGRSAEALRDWCEHRRPRVPPPPRRVHLSFASEGKRVRTAVLPV